MMVVVLHKKDTISISNVRKIVIEKIQEERIAHSLLPNLSISILYSKDENEPGLTCI